MTLEEILAVLNRHPNHSLEIDHTPQPFGVEDEDGYEGWLITLWDTRMARENAKYLPPHEHVAFKDVHQTIDELVIRLERR